MISLTNEQRSAVDLDGHAYLSACPGSGKTRVIIAKLLKLAESIEKTPLSIGCITYTNAAVDEIEARIKQVGTNRLVERCEISTIHKFCLTYILRPYGWLHPDIPLGFKILTPEKREFVEIIRAVEDEANRQFTRRAIDDYSTLRITTKGTPAGPGFEGGIVTSETATRYWQLVRARGFVDFSMILYYSYLILKENSFISMGLASRFKWVLVDEFQDTTALQMNILALLHQHFHSQFFLVGDENQSINSFAGASVGLGDKFCTHIGADRTHALSGNFRCAPQIVAPAQTLIPRNPDMEAKGNAKQISGIVDYKHVAKALNGIEDYFLPTVDALKIPYGSCAVLAPWWPHLIPVARHLRDLGVPVFGPGARPYKVSRLYARLAEELGACIGQGALLDPSGVEKALFRLIDETTGETRFDIFSYDGRRMALTLIYKAMQLANGCVGGVDWLETSSVEIGTILEQEGWITSEAAKGLVASVESMKSDMQDQIDLENLAVEDLGLFANPAQAIKLITMHSSKGREFDAVAIIHANDGQIPHFANRGDPEKLAESERLFYVGMTRAKKYLLVLSDQSNHKNPPSRFIAGSDLH